MPILTDESKAQAELERMVDATCAPTLDSDDIQSLLNSAKRGEVWAAETPYIAGTVVIPTEANRNGHRYKYLMSGTSGTTEPSWSVLDNATVSDGDLPLRESGPEIDLWDLRDAAFRGWQIKKARSVSATDSQEIRSSQISDHIKEMLQLYWPIGV